MSKKSLSQPEFKYNPSTVLEKKALFLEETLEKMVNAETYWLTQVKIPKRKAYAKKKVKDIRKGILEVDEKCNNIWKQIAKEKGN